jgi:hypothetical protein
MRLAAPCHGVSIIGGLGDFGMRNDAIKHALLNSTALATGTGLLAAFFANAATANPASLSPARPKG